MLPNRHWRPSAHAHRTRSHRATTDPVIAAMMPPDTTDAQTGRAVGLHAAAHTIRAYGDDVALHGGVHRQAVEPRASRICSGYAHSAPATRAW